MSAAIFDHPLLACPMCMSGASGQALLAANSAILLMLGVLVSVLASFGGFIFYLARRARNHADPEIASDSSLS